MKIALCLCGQMRQYKNEDLNLYNNLNLYSKFKLDLYISTWNKKGFSTKHGQIKKTIYENDIIKEEELINHYKKYNLNIKKINIENFDIYLENLDKDYKNYYYSPHHKELKVQSSIPIHYKYQDCINLIEEDYDYIIITRPDFIFIKEFKIYNNEMINNINYGKIYVKNRIYDPIFFGQFDKIKYFLIDIYNKIKENKNYKKINKLALLDNCRLLAVQAIKKNIKINDIDYHFGDIYRYEKIRRYLRNF